MCIYENEERVLLGTGMTIFGRKDITLLGEGKRSAGGPHEVGLFISRRKNEMSVDWMCGH